MVTGELFLAFSGAFMNQNGTPAPPSLRGFGEWDWLLVVAYVSQFFSIKYLKISSGNSKQMLSFIVCVVSPIATLMSGTKLEEKRVSGMRGIPGSVQRGAEWVTRRCQNLCNRNWSASRQELCDLERNGQLSGKRERVKGRC